MADTMPILECEERWRMRQEDERTRLLKRHAKTCTEEQIEEAGLANMRKQAMQDKDDWLETLLLPTGGKAEQQHRRLIQSWEHVVRFLKAKPTIEISTMRASMPTPNEKLTEGELDDLIKG